MVVKDEDILVVKTKKNWIKPGTEYAEKSWSCTYNRMGKASIYERMTNITKGITVQKTVEYLLKKKRIEFEIKDRKKWYEIDRYDIFVEGKRYDIKSNRCPPFVFRIKSWLLDASALVPTDQLYSRTLSDDDVYIFAFISYKPHNLCGYNPKSALAKPFIRKDGEWIVHGFWDYEFLKPKKWIDEHGTEGLGHIEIRSSSRKDKGKQFLLGGTAKRKKFQFETVTLSGVSPKYVTIKEFFQLFFIRAVDGNIPDGRITMKGENSKISEVINPIGGFEATRTRKGERPRLIQNDWGDIWLYNSYIYLAGFMTKGDFKKKSDEIKRFDKTVKQFEPQTNNNRLLVYKLNPIRKLFATLEKN